MTAERVRISFLQGPGSPLVISSSMGVPRFIAIQATLNGLHMFYMYVYDIYIYIWRCSSYVSVSQYNVFVKYN